MGDGPRRCGDIDDINADDTEGPHCLVYTSLCVSPLSSFLFFFFFFTIMLGYQAIPCICHGCCCWSFGWGNPAAPELRRSGVGACSLDRFPGDGCPQIKQCSTQDLRSRLRECWDHRSNINAFKVHPLDVRELALRRGEAVEPLGGGAEESEADVEHDSGEVKGEAEDD